MLEAQEPRPGWSGYLGLFLTALATLMFEILLTRIFSVTLWHHLAFVAVSIALFGMSVGAIVIFLFPKFFTRERAPEHLAYSSLLFAITIILSFIGHSHIRFLPPSPTPPPDDHGDILRHLATYLIISVPFVFSGMAVCLALTKFPRHVSKLYAADLAGAALGCLLIIGLLEFIGDGPAVVFVTAALTALGALAFSFSAGRRVQQIVLVGATVLTLGAIWISARAMTGNPIVRLAWVKGEREEKALFERWNSYSRVRITGRPELKGAAQGWGISSTYPKEKDLVSQLALVIDGYAATWLTKFDGNPAVAEHLKYDITNLAHYIRHDADVAVIGAGGGRDLLSAVVAFKQHSVTGIEYNSNVMKGAYGQFGDFIGHLDKYPGIHVVHDEARSYLTRTKDKFDIIEASLVDTFAATAAGAFALTENSLYTTDAWKLFFERLNPCGLLTFSRFYINKEMPGEMYRLVALAADSLRATGAAEPVRHIVVVRQLWNYWPEGIGTILVSKCPFSDADLDQLEKICAQMNFEIVQSPRTSVDEGFQKVASAKSIGDVIGSFPIDISAPTDNRPFFFFMIKFSDLLNSKLRDTGYYRNYLNRIVNVIGWLLVAVTVMTFLCIIVPLYLTQDRKGLKGRVSLLLFFAAIGFGFMLLELSQMQRLTIFLGQPFYALSVVLFSMLIGSGIGSFSTNGIEIQPSFRPAITRLALLVIAIAIFGAATTPLLQHFRGAETLERAAIAGGLLLPLGFFLGMAFPLGMKLACSREEALTPWLWGINGATSVCGSVLAAVLALFAGIQATYWCGLVCYLVALGTFVWSAYRER